MIAPLQNNILIVAAHPDDEVLGVGGTILKYIKNGDKVNILILGDGETSRNTGADVTKRAKQAQKVARMMRVTKLFLEKLADNKFDSVPILETIKIIEKYIQNLKPTIVYTHHPYDLNIDHQITFKATLTACRPQPNFFVKKMLTFETLSSTEWQLKNQINNFCPNEYQNITEFMDKKIKALKSYQDELRRFPHPRSVEGIKILAQFRGLEIGYKYAEAFQSIRTLHD